MIPKWRSATKKRKRTNEFVPFCGFMLEDQPQRQLNILGPPPPMNGLPLPMSGVTVIGRKPVRRMTPSNETTLDRWQQFSSADGAFSIVPKEMEQSESLNAAAKKFLDSFKLHRSDND